ncbi:hypothetical protein NQ317_001071 [Molorchus minor]|uniref:DNA-directed DNA polymerase n=1 Tax=Molorchus minor TaxID=1323400 RepID=A0ABQ9JN52_9CUCU|nr:hypothetical protein NQ317_001071 [Molorchus minor]
MKGINFPVKLRDISKFEELNNISINVYGLESIFEDNKMNIRKNDCNHIYTTTPTTQLRIDKYGREIPKNILQFENFERQMMVPLVVYADFESVLKPIQTCEENPGSSYTNKTFMHEPYSFSYFMKCSFDNSISKFQLYRGPDAAKIFVSTIESDLKEIYNKYLKHAVPMIPLTAAAAEEQSFQDANFCGICGKTFEEDDARVRDHCHLTGRVRPGAAHSVCSLNYKLPNIIPIIFHNIGGYDCHLFIKELCVPGVKVYVLAQNKEK